MTTKRIDRASRRIAARPSAVYRALVDPDARVAWLAPKGMHARLDAFDARVGGGYRMTLTYDDASGARGKSSPGSDVVHARFVALDEGARVVEAIEFESADASFAGTMTMTWSLEAIGEGTSVTVTAEDVPPGIRPADHQLGMQSSLESLASFVER